MIKEYIVKVTDEVLPNAFLWFETEYSPEQELVRCEDCKHYRYYGLSQDTVSECELDICPNPARDWFCAEGERQ